MKSLLNKSSHWLLLFLGLDLTFMLVAWLIEPKLFRKLTIFILLFTALAVGIGYWWEQRTQRRQIVALQNFWGNPNENNLQTLLEFFNQDWHTAFHAFYRQLQTQTADLNQKHLDLQNYQEYIEAWTHEIKTPLALITLVLHNHKDKMSPYVYRRIQHAGQQLGENVERILYYARLQYEHVDYKFAPLDVAPVVQEVLAEFRTWADEKNITFQLDLPPAHVVTDAKVLRFMLTQIISNAVKYAPAENGIIQLRLWQEASAIHLMIRDNGAGVPPEDAPFIFDKGFTGNHPDRQKATGMGLYLVKKYAQALALEIRLVPLAQPESGFAIELIFPTVE